MIKRNNRGTSGIVNLSVNSHELMRACMESIINLGYDFRHNIVYLTELDGVYRLYIGYYGLGTILDSDTSQPEVLFKELISSLKKELGVFESFVFPCETSNWRFKGFPVIVKHGDTDYMNNHLQKSCRISAYNSKRLNSNENILQKKFTVEKFTWLGLRLRAVDVHGNISYIIFDYYSK